MHSNMVYMGVLVNALFVLILTLVTKFFQDLFAQENVMGHSINIFKLFCRILFIYNLNF